MSVLTIASYIGVLVPTLMMWTPGNAALRAASSHAAAAPLLDVQQKLIRSPHRRGRAALAEFRAIWSVGQSVFQATAAVTQ